MEILEQLNTIIDTQKTRYLRFQKVVFLSEIKKILEKEGIETHLLTDIFRNQKYHSLVIGNLKDAKKVIVSHYDTSNLIQDFFKFEPFEIKKRQRISLIIDAIKSIIICIISGFILFTFVQSILNGVNVTLFSILSLALFLISVLFIRMPILLPSFRNENRNTIKYVFRRILEKDNNTSFVLVDDGMNYQMGYQILSKNLKQSKRNYNIELLDHIDESLNVKQLMISEVKNTRMKYFDELKVKSFIS